MRIPDQEIQQQIFPCPACGQNITATITLTVRQVGTAVSDDYRTAELTFDTKISRFTILHRCQGRAEATDDLGSAD